MRLKEKVAIITGGGSGCGIGICKKFSDEGARVIVADINLSSAEEVAKDINGIALEVDVSNSASMKTFSEEVFTKFGNLDIVVNNAGVTHLPAPMETISEDEFDRVININVRSIYLSAKNFVPHMKLNKSGVILNMASTAGISPRPNLNWYNASKGWVITATKAMAVELAPYNVRVNALNPVAGETPLLKAFMGKDTPEIREKFLSTIPIGRFSTPEDLGNAACFLCSDEASMITGVAMEVDGGRCI